ncbi:MAG: type II secretion system protein F [Lachnospiraceae bacterium]|nr:type II secretion system protein F [Lachnospiraceae bacterium]
MILLLAYLFYNSWIACLVLSPILPVYLKIWYLESIHKKKNNFRTQFKDSMQALTAAVRVGYSIENALRETEKDLLRLYTADSRILREFRKMIHQLDMNFSVEHVLKSFSENVKQEEVEHFVIVFGAAKRMGGDSIEIIRDTAISIGEKIEVEKEIITMLAAKAFEFKVMSMIPFAIILYMRLTFGEFIYELYGNPVGIAVMSICLAVYVVAYLLGRKIVKIEV